MFKKLSKDEAAAQLRCGLHTIERMLHDRVLWRDGDGVASGSILRAERFLRDEAARAEQARAAETLKAQEAARAAREAEREAAGDRERVEAAARRALMASRPTTQAQPSAIGDNAKENPFAKWTKPEFVAELLHIDMAELDRRVVAGLLTAKTHPNGTRSIDAASAYALLRGRNAERSIPA